VKKDKELMIKSITGLLKPRGFIPSCTPLVYTGLSILETEYQVDLRGNNCKVYVRGEVSRVWIRVESSLISTLNLKSFEERMDKRLNSKDPDDRYF